MGVGRWEACDVLIASAADQATSEDSVLRRIKHMCIDLLCLDVHGAAHASIKTQWQDVVIITAHAFQVPAGGLV